MNELPLKNVMAKFGVQTKGPNLHGGEIGQSLPKAETLNIYPDFPLIRIDDGFAANLVAATDLTSDQKYLRDILLVISTGNIPDNFAKKSPGKIGYARWLTTANRILRVYISNRNPSDNLISITKYIVHVYACMWFEVKRAPLLIYGAMHVYNMIKNTRKLNNSIITDCVRGSLARNGYFLHSENRLVCMLSDNDQSIRKLAVERIISARVRGETGVRTFKIPVINFSAENYYNLIEYDDNWLEPRLTLGINDKELHCIDFEKYPCHNQAVERIICIVSETSTMLVCPKQRDTRIVTTIAHRKLFPSFDSKKDFRL